MADTAPIQDADQGNSHPATAKHANCPGNVGNGHPGGDRAQGDRTDDGKFDTEVATLQAVTTCVAWNGIVENPAKIILHFQVSVTDSCPSFLLMSVPAQSRKCYTLSSIQLMHPPTTDRFPIAGSVEHSEYLESVREGVLESFMRYLARDGSTELLEDSSKVHTHYRGMQREEQNTERGEMSTNSSITFHEVNESTSSTSSAVDSSSSDGTKKDYLEISPFRSKSFGSTSVQGPASGRMQIDDGESASSHYAHDSGSGVPLSSLSSVSDSETTKTTKEAKDGNRKLGKSHYDTPMQASRISKVSVAEKTLNKSTPTEKLKSPTTDSPASPHKVPWQSPSLEDCTLLAAKHRKQGTAKTGKQHAKKTSTSSLKSGQAASKSQSGRAIQAGSKIPRRASFGGPPGNKHDSENGESASNGGKTDLRAVKNGNLRDAEGAYPKTKNKGKEPVGGQQKGSRTENSGNTISPSRASRLRLIDVNVPGGDVGENVDEAGKSPITETDIALTWSEKDGQIEIVSTRPGGSIAPGLYGIEFQAKVMFSALERDGWWVLPVPYLLCPRDGGDDCGGLFLSIKGNDGKRPRVHLESDNVADHRTITPTLFQGKSGLEALPNLQVRTKKKVHILKQPSVRLSTFVYLNSSADCGPVINYLVKVWCDPEDASVFSDVVELQLAARNTNLWGIYNASTQSMPISLGNANTVESSDEEPEPRLDLQWETEDKPYEASLEFSVPLERNHRRPFSLPAFRPVDGKVKAEKYKIIKPSHPLDFEYLPIEGSLSTWEYAERVHGDGHSFILNRANIPHLLPMEMMDYPRIRVAEFEAVQFKSLCNKGIPAEQGQFPSLATELEYRLWQVPQGVINCKMQFEIQTGNQPELVAIDPHGWQASFSVVDGRVMTEDMGEWRVTGDGLWTLAKASPAMTGRIMLVQISFEKHIENAGAGETGQAINACFVLPQIVSLPTLSGSVASEIEGCKYHVGPAWRVSIDDHIGSVSIKTRRETSISRPKMLGPANPTLVRLPSLSGADEISVQFTIPGASIPELSQSPPSIESGTPATNFLAGSAKDLRSLHRRSQSDPNPRQVRFTDDTADPADNASEPTLKSQSSQASPLADAPMPRSSTWKPLLFWTQLSDHTTLPTLPPWRRTALKLCIYAAAFALLAAALIHASSTDQPSGILHMAAQLRAARRQAEAAEHAKSALKDWLVDHALADVEAAKSSLAAAVSPPIDAVVDADATAVGATSADEAGGDGAASQYVKCVEHRHGIRAALEKIRYQDELLEGARMAAEELRQAVVREYEEAAASLGGEQRPAGKQDGQWPGTRTVVTTEEDGEVRTMVGADTGPHGTDRERKLVKTTSPVSRTPLLDSIDHVLGWRRP